MESTNNVISLKCEFINIQSVGNINLEIRDLININRFDILSLAETWLSEFDTVKIAEKSKCNSNAGFRALKSAAPKLYNTVPQKVRILDNIENFVKQLRTVLFADCYNLDDHSVIDDYAV